MLRKISLYTILLVLVFFVFIILIVLFSRDYRHLHQAGVLHYPRFHRHSLASLRAARYIREWMTFDYINQTFFLPRSYLQLKLGIRDHHYPNITVKQAANEAHASSTSLYLRTVQSEVQRYLLLNDNSP